MLIDATKRRLADRFALRIPAPGGLFAGLKVPESAWDLVQRTPRAPTAASKERSRSAIPTSALAESSAWTSTRPSTILSCLRGRYRR